MSRLDQTVLLVDLVVVVVEAAADVLPTGSLVVTVASSNRTAWSVAGQFKVSFFSHLKYAFYLTEDASNLFQKTLPLMTSWRVILSVDFFNSRN